MLYDAGMEVTFMTGSAASSVRVCPVTNWPIISFPAISYATSHSQTVEATNFAAYAYPNKHAGRGIWSSIG